MEVLMDSEIFRMNLHYLILAHEMIHSGREQQAMLTLGLTPEAVNILSRTPVEQLKELASGHVLYFAPRFPASCWRTFLRNEDKGQDTREQKARRLRMFVAKLGAKR
jgi:hypothetical protein